MPDYKAATVTEFLTNFLEENKLLIKYLIGFGSDNAAVMIGKNHGIGKRLK